jgi:hypothetical protein
MISPSTAPGTRVVCSDAGPSEILGQRLPNGGLIRGAVYHVASIDALDFLTAREPYAVRLVELSRAPMPDGVDGWSLQRFNLAPLPDSLTRALEAIEALQPA